MKTLALVCLLLLTWLQKEVVASSKAVACKDDPKPCVTNGNLCETCSSLVTCIQTGSTYTKEHVKDCAPSENCVNAACVAQTTQTTVFCDGTACKSVPCTSVGIFPHPFYCNKFILCTEGGVGGILSAHEYECPNGWGYSVPESRCNVPLSVAGCDAREFPVPLCPSLGTVGVVPGSRYLYYICEPYSSKDDILYPFVYACQPGQVSDVTGCVPAPVTTTTTTPPPTTAPPPTVL